MSVSEAKSISDTESLNLCIDLDGTLLKTDTLLELVLTLLKQKPLSAFLLPLWCLKGKAYLKGQIARNVSFDVTSLPYHQELLSYLMREHKAGRRIVLATGAHITVAEQVAKHLGLFSMVLASDETNLTGAKKLQAISKYFGQPRFIYAGNSKADVPIWRSSKNAILVNTPDRLARHVNNLASVIHVFNDRSSAVREFIKAIRIHQWVKNTLVFIPLIAGHQITNPARLFDVLLAFIAFSLCASGSYIVNDLLDLDADRHDPTKRDRPFAAGNLSLKVGMIAPPLFFLTGLTLGWFLTPSFWLILGLYSISTLIYSLFLKRVVLLDVFMLASLYTLRIIGGGAAAQIHISSWLLLFSLFLFLSLAFLKRFSELQSLRREGQDGSKFRGYLLVDLEQLAIMGSASGYVTALVLALYINSNNVKILYKHPEILWFICPLILHWISRAWLIARRGQMHDDPVVFAIKDVSTSVIAIITALIVFLATS